MSTTPEPRIRTLDASEITDVLARNHVGRLAYERRGRINIEPIHYVYAADWLYARTADGEKYQTLAQSFYRIWPVAFEVDEVENLFRWRSVVVHGNASLVVSPQEGGDADEWETAVAQIRMLIPEALTDADPTPLRTAVFRIGVQEATGRACDPGL